MAQESPRRYEVEKQLERMLGRAPLATARRLAAILEFAVASVLNGRDISEKEIAWEVFGGYNPESPIVRVSAGDLRTKLRQYYEGPGREDLVVISLPPGPSYKPVFSYHKHSPCLRHYRRGLARLFNPLASSTSLSRAISDFEKAIEVDPGFAPAYARKSEAEVLGTILSDAFDVMVPRWRIFIDDPFGFSVMKALELDPKLVAAHIIRATVHTVLAEWDDAEREFSLALTLDPVETRGSWWYAAYLLTTGRLDDALNNAEAIVSENVGSRNAALVYALFLYVARRYQEAIEILDHAVGVSDFFFHVEERPLDKLLGGLVYLGMGKSGTAFSLLERASKVHASELQFNTDVCWKKHPVRCAGLVLLCLTHLSEEVPSERRLRLKDELTVQEKRDQLIAQLRQNQLAIIGYEEKRTDKIYLPPFQAALAYMALGQTRKVFAALRLAAQCDVLTRWLHLWPFFDPLRSDNRFQDLIEQSGIIPPEQSSS